MATPAEPSQQVQFGEFALDLRTGELWRDGDKLALRYQSFQILTALLERPGEMVTREELVKRLWASDVFVDFEGSLNKAMNRLREALLDAADQPRFIETLPRRGFRFIAPVRRTQPPPTESNGLVGKKVSHYRVLEVIGGGGMGMVYKAEDLKLGRRVALKFLPEELATDAIALRRFDREARTASSLNHPNICTIYEIEEYEGQPFIVMELLQGETLRDRLAAAEGVLPFAETLDIAIQVSNGLQGAHELGIIHRDIKPGNIFITGKGICKILDFGLAKLLEMGDEEEPAAAVAPAQAAEDSQGHGFGRPVHDLSLCSRAPNPTVDSHLTRTGSAMGTAGYMSPEQVRGEKLDARSDLFSFGLVLYEMATGQRAFGTNTVEDVCDGILHRQPEPLCKLNPKVPAHLERIISKALEKDRSRRYSSAQEVAKDLENACEELNPTAGRARQAEAPEKLRTTGTARGEAEQSSGVRGVIKAPRRLLAWSAGFCLMLATSAIAYFFVIGQERVPFEHYSIRRVLDNKHVTMTAISPDGNYLAAVVLEANGAESLLIYHIPTSSERPILQNAAYKYLDLIFSPDGSYVYFRILALGDPVDREVDQYRIPVLGGQATRVLEGVDVPISFIDEGQRVCFYRQGVPAGSYKFISARVDGGDEQVLAQGKMAVPYSAACAPNGRFAVITQVVGGIESLDFASGSKQALAVSGTTLGGWLGKLLWAPNGKGLFVVSKKSVHPARQIGFLTYPGGKMRPITNDLSDYSGTSLTADATTIATTQNDMNARFSELSLADPSHERAHEIGGLSWFTWLANDKIVGADLDAGLRAVDLLNDQTTELNVAKGYWFAHPALCGSDGLVVRGSTLDGDSRSIYRMHLDGSGLTQLTHGPDDVFPECTSDGKWLYYVDNRDWDNPRLMRQALPSGAAQAVTPANVWFALSADDKFIAVTTHPAGPCQVQVFSTDSLQKIKSFPFFDVTAPPVIAFSADNRSVLYISKTGTDTIIWRQPLATDTPVKLANLPGKDVISMRPSPDGTKLGLITMAPTSEAVLLRDIR